MDSFGDGAGAATSAEEGKLRFLVTMPLMPVGGPWGVPILPSVPTPPTLAHPASTTFSDLTAAPSGLTETGAASRRNMVQLPAFAFSSSSKSWCSPVGHALWWKMDKTSRYAAIQCLWQGPSLIAFWMSAQLQARMRLNAACEHQNIARHCERRWRCQTQKYAAPTRSATARGGFPNCSRSSSLVHIRAPGPAVSAYEDETTTKLLESTCVNRRRGSLPLILRETRD